MRVIDKQLLKESIFGGQNNQIIYKNEKVYFINAMYGLLFKPRCTKH